MIIDYTQPCLQHWPRSITRLGSTHLTDHSIMGSPWSDHSRACPLLYVRSWSWPSLDTLDNSEYWFSMVPSRCFLLPATQPYPLPLSLPWSRISHFIEPAVKSQQEFPVHWPPHKWTTDCRQVPTRVQGSRSAGPSWASRQLRTLQWHWVSMKLKTNNLYLVSSDAQTTVYC